MIATLLVEYADGTTDAFASDTTWKTAAHAAEGWQRRGFDDAAWKAAVHGSQPMTVTLRRWGIRGFRIR